MYLLKLGTNSEMPLLINIFLAQITSCRVMNRESVTSLQKPGLHCFESIMWHNIACNWYFPSPLAWHSCVEDENRVCACLKVMELGHFKSK